MMLIELLIPPTAPDEPAPSELAERLLGAVTHAEGASPEEDEAHRAIWQVLVRRTDAWLGGTVPHGNRYVVRIDFPAVMLSDEGRAHFYARIADAFPGDAVSVYINPVAEGDFGTGGAAMRSADFVREMVAGEEERPAVPVEPGAASAVDPVCGMTVKLSEDAILLEHEGAVYAFCNSGCREVFSERLAAA
ncbi:YHS domain-containing protein [Glycomyces arizonensis]|uniref:YHS domain-containing protein n=1 Tax=Glycomyces arizonensis TaxID=256035 RepID=UPI00041061B1|nr:YHS domain-containing protein [Glycomyces arizonensis]